MYQTPTMDDFQRNLAAMLKQTRETAHRDSQRIRVEHAARGLDQSGPLISAEAERFDKLHAETIETMMRLIGDFVARTRISPKEFADTVRPVLETIGAEWVAQIPHLGNETLNRATEQVRARYRGKFAERLDGALRDIEIGFVRGQNMITPVKDADRRAVILQRLYDERHVRSWVAFPLDQSASQEEQIIAANICGQLRDAGLIEWKSVSTGQPQGMAHITGRGVDVVEGNTTPPIAISIDRSISVSGSTRVQIGDRNVQGLHLNADKVTAAINSSTASEAEKEEAKSLLGRVLDNPILSKIIGGVIGL